MNYQIHESQMPKLSINDEEFKQLLYNAISNFNSSGFQFIHLKTISVQLFAEKGLDFQEMNSQHMNQNLTELILLE